jgi:hypothetical protein
VKEKLKKFKNQTNTLLPHETAYLLKKQKIQDPEKLEILKIVDHNAKFLSGTKPFDESIDKRKYSNLLKWIQNELHKIDVDKGLEWINLLQKQILTDSIPPRQELLLIRSLNKYTSSSYYFMKFYDLLVEYRHYLLIRMRYNDHKKVNDYLEKLKFDYQRSKLINDQMHQATIDIIGKSGSTNIEGIQWKKWLTECCMDEKLDGLNRYMALVRLSFICLKYNMLQDLESILIDSDALFNNGNNYSKRILLNYYDNMLVLYDKKEEYDKAIYYGYLSIKDLNQDSIIYVNNLVNVLLKTGKFAEGLEIIENVNFKISSTKNFHSVIGFVSNHIRCLSKTGKSKQAIIKGKIFLEAYHKDILQYRWHRFFTAYLEALIQEEKFITIIRVINKFNLLKKEKESSGTQAHVNNISVYLALAQYQENRISIDKFKSIYTQLTVNRSINNHILDNEITSLIANYTKG